MRDGLKKEADFEVIFRENYSLLYCHAMSFLNDRETAKDVVSGVFELFLARYDQLNLSISVTPLLYTLVRNSCVDYLRRLKAQERYSSEVLWTSGEPVDEYDLEYDELIEKLRCSIEQLPEQTCVVFKRCFVHGKKYQEAADELDISVNTVKTHIKKALKLLREEFTDNQLILCVCFYKLPGKR